MVSLARKLAVAFSMGITLGTILFFLGSVVSTIVPDTPLFAAVGFVVGFGSPIAVMFAEDMGETEDTTSTPASSSSK